MNTIQRSPTPLITIGMLTKNRSWCLPQVLARMEEMDYPKEQIKIVFVDGNSTDDTFSMLRKWKEREETEYHDILLIQKECNIPEGRNICIRQMEGDYLIFWDSDVIPAKDFIRILIKHFHMNERLGMIGADYTYENDELKTVLRNIKTHALYMGFTAIKKEVFDRVGTFNEKLEIGEDTELGINVSEKTNYVIQWAPQSVLHLKQGERQRTGWKRSWLSYNFSRRSKQYAESFNNLPRFLKGRIVYYLLLPWVLSSPLFLLMFSHFTVFLVFPPLVYLCFGLLNAIKNTNVKRGIKTFFSFYLPTGLALSYGVLLQLCKEAFSRG